MTGRFHSFVCSYWWWLHGRGNVLTAYFLTLPECAWEFLPIQELHKLNSELDTSTKQLQEDLAETKDERSQLLARVFELGM